MSNKPRCKDCGLHLLGKECEGELQETFDRDGKRTGEFFEGHPGICCDCFDEKLGMPESKRLRKRIR